MVTHEAELGQNSGSADPHERWGDRLMKKIILVECFVTFLVLFSFPLRLLAAKAQLRLKSST